MFSKAFSVFSARENDGPKELGIKESKEPAECPIEKLQERAEVFSDRTQEHVMEKYGEGYRAEKTRELAELDEELPVEVLENDEYQQRFPAHPYTVLGNCDEHGKVSLREAQPNVVEHAAVHETEHRMSFHEVEQAGDTTRVRSGIREYSYSETADGNEAVVSDECRTLNEGVTQLYTERELKGQGSYGPLYSIRPYSEAKYQAACVEKLVGKERLERAYYLGEKEELVKEFNRLNGDEQAWNRFNEDVDLYAKTEGSELRAEAGRRINETFIAMYEAKEAENGKH